MTSTLRDCEVKKGVCAETGFPIHHTTTIEPEYILDAKGAKIVNPKRGGLMARFRCVKCK